MTIPYVKITSGDGISFTHVDDCNVSIGMDEDLKTSVAEALKDVHTHANKAILDATSASFTTDLQSELATAFADAHTHANKAILDATTASFTTDLQSELSTAFADAHTHANKNLLDSLINSGDGESFLANDGKYKAVNSGIQIGVCTTAGATTEKAVTLNGVTLTSGTTIEVTFIYANTTTAPILNVNSLGAIPIASEDGTVTSATNPFYVPAGVTVEFTYNGTNWVYKNRVVTNYVNGTSWYRIWSNGYIEQGGVTGTVAADGLTYNLSFLLPFKNVNYSLFYRGFSAGDGRGGVVFFCNSDTNRTASSVSIYAYNYYVTGNTWRAFGY